MYACISCNNNHGRVQEIERERVEHGRSWRGPQRDGNIVKTILLYDVYKKIFLSVCFLQQA